MTTEKKKFANHVKNASAPLRYDSRCMGARWGGRGSDFQKSRSREPPYSWTRSRLNTQVRSIRRTLSWAVRRATAQHYSNWHNGRCISTVNAGKPLFDTLLRHTREP